ncbi:MAG: CRISPR-associated protein Cas4 [Lachnospiraceae bacterium]
MKESEYREEDFLQLAGLQHFSFCRRQWALIHIEQQWVENVLTTEGNIFHKKAHDGYSSEKRRDIIISRGMPVHSRVLGISGECDIVEFHRTEEGIMLPGREGNYKVYPIEYKRGKSKITDEDRLQLTAQAMCLEEMFVTDIPEAYLFYGETRRREQVEITEELRDECQKLLQEMHQLYARGYTPVVKKAKKCDACSLKEICLPKLEKSKKVVSYISGYLEDEE